jgi:hypothetical protein
MFWVFKLSFVVDILAFFTWQLFGPFFEKFGEFFFLIIWSLFHSGKLRRVHFFLVYRQFLLQTLADFCRRKLVTV